MPRRNKKFTLGCFLLCVIPVCLYFAFRIDTSPIPTTIGSLPINQWIANTRAIQGPDLEAAMSELNIMLVESQQGLIMNCGIGIIGRRAQKHNNQLHANWDSIRENQAAFASILSTAASAKDLETRRVALLTLQSLSSFCSKTQLIAHQELYEILCNDTDPELATKAWTAANNAYGCFPDVDFSIERNSASGRVRIHASNRK